MFLSPLISFMKEIIEVKEVLSLLEASLLELHPLILS